MRVSNNTKYFQDSSYVQYQSKFDEHNNWLETRDKYFNNKSQCHYIKKYNNQGVFYEEWRDYYSNGVLKKCLILKDLLKNLLKKVYQYFK